MNEKQYTVNFSYTLDFVTWTCPVCGNYVEKCGIDIDDLECEDCGFKRPECQLDSQDTTSDSEILTYYEEEEM